MQKFKLNYILCLVFILVLCPFSILAEDPEQGEVIIQTDGTYSDHEVIDACEVGSMVKLDIGSFDTAYINNNFDFNANIDGYVYFECGSYNDIKLAFYGINQTIYSDDISSFTNAQINALSNLDYNSDILIYKSVLYSPIYYTTSISNYNSSNGVVSFNDYSSISISGGLSYIDRASSLNLNSDDNLVYYLRYNGETYYNGLPTSITGEIINFDEIASIYINPIFDSYSQSISNIDAPTYSITLSNYKMTLNGQLKCEYFYSGTDLCYNYVFENKTEDSNGNSITYPYATIDIPNIFITNTNNASQLGVSGYNSYTFHYDVLITFDDEYIGFLEFQNTGKFYVNGSELRFTKTTTYRSDSPSFYYELILTDYNLKRKIDPLVNPVEDDQKESVSKNEAQNAELDSVINEYNEIEGQFKDNLDTSLNDIDFSFDFGNITDFSTSANFVRTQFDNLTDNPFGSLVGFSLAVGLALLIMGRRL